MAFIRSFLPTSSIKNDCLVGISSVLTMPKSRANTSRCQYCTTLKKVILARMKARTARLLCVKISTLRFGNLSTRVPAYNAKNIIGKNCIAVTRLSLKAECVNCRTSQAWPIFCIHEPINDIHCPNQNSLKFRCRNDWKLENIFFSNMSTII